MRIALGANRGDVMRLLVGRGAGATLAGAAIGTLGALAVSRVLASMLFGYLARHFHVRGGAAAAGSRRPRGLGDPRLARDEVDPASVLRSE